jgi:hypothetical protein
MLLYKHKQQEQTMASVKKGTVTRPPQWWKHLKEYKRVFWKAERHAHKQLAQKECGES